MFKSPVQFGFFAYFWVNRNRNQLQVAKNSKITGPDHQKPVQNGPVKRKNQLKPVKTATGWELVWTDYNQSKTGSNCAKVDHNRVYLHHNTSSIVWGKCRWRVMRYNLLHYRTTKLEHVRSLQIADYWVVATCFYKNKHQEHMLTVCTVAPHQKLCKSDKKWLRYNEILHRIGLPILVEIVLVVTQSNLDRFGRFFCCCGANI